MNIPLKIFLSCSISLKRTSTITSIISADHSVAPSESFRLNAAAADSRFPNGPHHALPGNARCAKASEQLCRAILFQISMLHEGGAQYTSSLTNFALPGRFHENHKIVTGVTKSYCSYIVNMLIFFVLDINMSATRRYVDGKSMFNMRKRQADRLQHKPRTQPV